ncbi:dihydrolipoyllysine-residue succinyltransferase [Buchnera aphidicola]|uniref:dihydrolipoyllysine-residue succinyltransferase n=1 Tax=Buchnera aphidicola TaxID=9 RepID=UPI0034646D3A
MKEVNILVPDLPESINHAKVINWHKKIGDIVKQEEILLDIETEKVIVEVPATVNGILLSILKFENEIVYSKEILGIIQNINNIPKNDFQLKNNNTQNITNQNTILKKKICQKYHFSPSIRKLIAKNDLSVSQILKNKKYFHLNQKNISSFEKHEINENVNINKRTIKKIPIPPIRKRIGERLLQTKNNTAMLTTFNEVNMKYIIDLRNKYSKLFYEQNNIKLGFMSFFVKAVVESLKKFPDVNAKIEDNNIIYYNYFDINIAISTKIGLVTPVLKNADNMTMSEIEKKIKDFAFKGNNGKLELSDLIGGNFTITNGGVFGSLISTPIINPPQTAILGMHVIKDRPMVINGQIKILPMMYLALSYDHKLLDGKEAVGFLNEIKNILEDFSKILLNL